MKDKKGVLAKIRELFEVSNVKMEGDYKTLDGRIIRCYGETLELGVEVKEITEDGEMALEDGDYSLEDGTTLSVVGGKITEVSDTASDNVEGETEMGVLTDMGFLDTSLLDGTKVRVEGVDLIVGAKIEIEKDGSWIQAPEGQHDLADGRVIFVDGEGLINDIQTAETRNVSEVGMEEIFKSIEELTSIVFGLKENFNSVVNENKELKERFNAFSKSPSTETIKKVPMFSSTQTKEEKLKFFGQR